MQKFLRMWLAVRRFKRMQIAVVLIQYATRSRNVRLAYLYSKLQERSVLLVQTQARVWIASSKFQRKRIAARVMQNAFHRSRRPKVSVWDKTASALNDIMVRHSPTRRNHMVRSHGVPFRR